MGIISAMEKSSSRFRTLLLLVSAVLVAFGQPTGAASRGCTIDREERSVLTTILQNMTGQSRSVLVVESRTDSSHFARISLTDLLSREATSDLPSQVKAAPSGSTLFLSNPSPIIPPREQHELEQEYNAKLSEPCSIPVMMKGSKQLLFKTPAQVDEVLSGSDFSKGWIRFHQLFGKNAELVVFSRVAFDKAKQYALVHVSSGISADGGDGELYLLSRQNGNWAIKRTFVTWAT